MTAKLDCSKVRAILLARAQGMPYRQIAKTQGVAVQTALETCQKHEELLAKLEAANLEQLYSELELGYRERLRAQASLLSDVKAELARRDWGDVPTEKLAGVFLKMHEAITAGLVAPDFTDRPYNFIPSIAVPREDWKLVADAHGTDAERGAAP